MTSPGSAYGAELFARYAYPPNELGHCGPEDPELLLKDPAAAARQFEGAWVYQELIAAATGIADPMDPRVVEAYWVGNNLLDDVEPESFLDTLTERFAGQLIGPTGQRWYRMPTRAALAHHNFHVFAVYPWVSLLAPNAPGGIPLSVLENCRIRWGTVLAQDGDRLLVESRPLTWDGHQLALGPERPESVRWSTPGYQRPDPPPLGALVSCHWDWACDRLTERQTNELSTRSAHQLAATNQALQLL